MQEVGELQAGEALDYAFGLRIDQQEGERRVQHGGAMFGYRAQLSIYPDRGFGVAVLCNLATADPGRRAARVAALRLGGAQPPSTDSVVTSAASSDERPAMALRSESLERWVGDYSLGPGVALTIRPEAGRLETGRLEMVDPDGASVALEALSEHEFRLADESGPFSSEVQFADGEDGPRMSVMLGGSRRELVPLPERAKGSDLDQWVGSYRSEELAATAQIARDSGRLTYQIGMLPPRPLTTRVDRTIALPGMVGQGEGAADQPVAAFVLDAGRVQGIRFTRVKPD